MATKAAAAPAAPAEFSFASAVAAATAVAIPTPAVKAAAENPFTESVAGLLLKGKPRTVAQTTANPDWKDDNETGSRLITVPGPIDGETCKKALRLLNDAGRILGVTVRKNTVQGMDGENVVTQLTYWAVERQERPRKDSNA